MTTSHHLSHQNQDHLLLRPVVLKYTNGITVLSKCLNKSQFWSHIMHAHSCLRVNNLTGCKFQVKHSPAICISWYHQQKTNTQQINTLHAPCAPVSGLGPIDPEIQQNPWIGQRRQLSRWPFNTLTAICQYVNMLGILLLHEVWLEY